MAGYLHVHAFWGAVDIDLGSGAYTPADRVSLGPSAAPTVGIGVRRAQFVIDPTPPGSFADDVRTMHFDFLNITGGSPDDTWTSGDYTTMDTHALNLWGAMSTYITTAYHLREVRWYRIGPGVNPPNPPEHVVTVGAAGTSSSDELLPQAALSLTFKTADRKRWGRTYVPGLTTAILDTHGVAKTASVDALGAALDTIMAATIGDDFHPVVYSKTTQAANYMEKLQIDNLLDVIRSRRWRNATHKYLTP